MELESELEKGSNWYGTGIKLRTRIGTRVTGRVGVRIDVGRMKFGIEIGSAMLVSVSVRMQTEIGIEMESELTSDRRRPHHLPGHSPIGP